MRKFLVVALLGFVLSCEPSPSTHHSALVDIHTYGENHISGTGFFVDTGGLVATALHVICGNEPDAPPDSILVRTSDGRVYMVKSVLAMDIPMDICIVKVGLSNKDHLVLSEKLSPGDSVVIKGKTEIPTLFSFLYQDELGYKWGYLDATIEHGYSGSPIMWNSRVIGIAVRNNIFAPSSYVKNLLSARDGITIKEAHDRYVETPYAFVNFAGSAIDAGDTSKAISYLKKAIKMRPALADAHYNLALMLCGQGRYSDAEREYREAIMINPNHAEAHNNMGSLFYDQGRYEEAEEEWREAIRINPGYAKAQYNLGISLFAQGKYREAQTELQKALELFEKRGDHENAQKAEQLLKGLPE